MNDYSVLAVGLRGVLVALLTVVLGCAVAMFALMALERNSLAAALYAVCSAAGVQMIWTLVRQDFPRRALVISIGSGAAAAISITWWAGAT
jgi:hypothetical protein